jgi:hypothetical protein
VVQEIAIIAIIAKIAAFMFSPNQGAFLAIQRFRGFQFLAILAVSDQCHTC